VYIITNGSAITSHYVDEDFKLHEDLLDFHPLNCQHTGENLARVLYNILKDFNIHTRLYCITTDNASNNTTLVKELEMLLRVNDAITWDSSKHHIPCLAHIINLTVKAFLNKLKIAAPSREEEFMEESNNNDSDELKAEQEIFEINAGNEFHRAIQKIRKISKAINFPPSRLHAFQHFCDATNIKRLRPVKDHEIRWNSTFNMIHRALFLKAAIDTWTRSRAQYANLVLTECEWELAAFLMHFLLPFKRATDYLQFTKKATLHKTYETYENLFNSLENVKAKFALMTCKPDWISQVETAIQAMWDKLQKYYTKSSAPPVFADAIILHPSYKMKWFKKQDWKDDLIEKYKQRSRKRFETEYNSPAASIIPSKRQFLDSSDEDEDFNEFDQFVRSKRHADVKYPLLWWANSRSTFPRLSNMARDVYAVPATGCGVEREFSMSGNVVNKPRNRLHGKTIANIMQYKRWVANTHQSFVIEEDTEMCEKMEGWSDSEDDLEYNQGLVDWLEEWEKEKGIDERAEGVLQTYH
jgi:hypothetical protein